jgi:hypothetical protein|nr:MAG TPA: immunity protein [Caudoviricetes sp.]
MIRMHRAVWHQDTLRAIGILNYGMTNDNYAMKVTDIYEAMNSKAEAFFEWLQAHPKYGLLFGVGLLALWLAGLLFRWKWACEWQFHGKLWFFDDCKPETRRRIKIVLVSVLIILILVDFFVWR